ncbi:hypothetical protein PNIG_a3367 [Pseudoalteromonas nigrifaciens]|uniref:Uncharacterized protein n=1 Tax=Pseudoalteromonas nigrifaciens TaxID=28109 RepID=A0AAC9UHH3_9GAMM|nr:hypothetical protein PNIG_a3367 [Pseudoalteromonas nigrifaciens]
MKSACFVLLSVLSLSVCAAVNAAENDVEASVEGLVRWFPLK